MAPSGCVMTYMWPTYTRVDVPSRCAGAARCARTRRGEAALRAAALPQSPRKTRFSPRGQREQPRGGDQASRSHVSDAHPITVTPSARLPPLLLSAPRSRTPSTTTPRARTTPRPRSARPAPPSSSSRAAPAATSRSAPSPPSPSTSTPRRPAPPPPRPPPAPRPRSSRPRGSSGSRSTSERIMAPLTARTPGASSASRRPPARRAPA